LETKSYSVIKESIIKNMETKTIKAFGTEAINVPLHSMNIKRRVLLPHDVEMNNY
jgi:stage V sporulation protein SpoVS